MEEQRQRQEEETRRAAVVSTGETGVSSPTADGKRGGVTKMGEMARGTGRAERNIYFF